MKLVLSCNLEFEHSNNRLMIELSQIEWSYFATQDQSEPFQKKSESEQALVLLFSFSFSSCLSSIYYRP